jgi:hypothetical protein
VIKESKIRKKSSVELQQPAVKVSRIRRDPPAKIAEKAVRPYPTEREIWTVAIGVLLFALAITVVTVGVSGVTSPSGVVLPH